MCLCKTVLLLCGFFSSSASMYHQRLDTNCGSLPEEVLENVLGPAFNSRYMSISPPNFEEEEQSTSIDQIEILGLTKRKTKITRDFYVDDKYALPLSDKPAWEVKHVLESFETISRNKREIPDLLDMDMTADLDMGRGKRRPSLPHPFGNQGGSKTKPWRCESKIIWTDLGADYFPRYLRTVECTKSNCWYGHYACLPRSFTIKLLKKKSGECISSDKLHSIGVVGLPDELREMWIWEERAVNFCCDCAINM